MNNNLDGERNVILKQKPLMELVYYGIRLYQMI